MLYTYGIPFSILYKWLSARRHLNTIDNKVKAFGKQLNMFIMVNHHPR